MKTYFIQSIIGGRIKIGKSVDTARRLQELQSCSPVHLRVLATIEGDHELEMHQAFRGARSYGEWFNPTQELIDFIETNSGKPVRHVHSIDLDHLIRDSTGLCPKFDFDVLWDFIHNNCNCDCAENEDCDQCLSAMEVLAFLDQRTREYVAFSIEDRLVTLFRRGSAKIALHQDIWLSLRDFLWAIDAVDLECLVYAVDHFENSIELLNIFETCQQIDSVLAERAARIDEATDRAIDEMYREYSRESA